MQKSKFLQDHYYYNRSKWLVKRPMKIFFAGLWERWVKDEVSLETFAIITTTVNGKMKNIHAILINYRLIQSAKG